MMRRRVPLPRSWWAGMAVTLLVLTLSVAACGPEDTRSRDGGLGGSSRPEPSPSLTSAPELITRPTANTPYATGGPLPTLSALPTATGAGFGVPTTAPNTTGGGTPTRAGSPAATPTR